jgi:hypothetical protein
MRSKHWKRCSARVAAARLNQPEFVELDRIVSRRRHLSALLHILSLGRVEMRNSEKRAAKDVTRE